PLGFVAGAPRALPALTWLGLTCAGVGVAVRVLRPGELVARWLVVAGAALFLIGALWPHDDIARVLPEELAALHPPWQPASGTILGTAWDGLGVGALVAVVSAWWLAPVALLPLVTLLTWRRPTGLWDGAGHWLRLLGAAVAMWLPLACALLAFNLMGWDAPRDLADLVLGRIRLALYATAATLWVVGGATAAILVWRDSQGRDAGGPTA
ncbi:MAG: hypothetical protein KC464_03750, partial [Myxococcales bacterium]|nr:hypothetical protein [Myxococcales bacterium]